jgi:hypothetical protein
MKSYKTTTLPVLLWDSEAWTVQIKDVARIQAAEMKFSRSVKGCTIMGKIRNEEIRKQLDIFSVEKKRIQNTITGTSSENEHRNYVKTSMYV